MILICCAWEHFDNSCDHVPRLADGQGITAVPMWPYWTGWGFRVNSSQRGGDLWVSPHRRCTPQSISGRGEAPVEQVQLEASVAVEMSVPQQVHLAASMPMDKAMTKGTS